MKADKDKFTKIASSLLFDMRDLVNWGIETGNTTPDKLRLSVAARRETAIKLIESGMSQRQAAKALGVDHKTIQNDLANKSPKSGDKVANKKKTKLAAGPHLVDRCAMTMRRVILEFVREINADQLDELFASLRDELADVEKIANERRTSNGHNTTR